jgi:5-amino-6-(5-phosphoribosylamino)uracil reductase
MMLSRVYPGHPESLDLDAADARDALLELYRPESMSTFRINLIGSVTGAAAGTDGTSHSLSNPTDRKILGVIRELADVVVVGAASVRVEGYVMPRRVPLAVVTSSGDLSGHGFAPDIDERRLLILCPDAAAARVREHLAGIAAEIIVLEDEGGVLDPADIVTALRVRGLESIVCEGGPDLAGRFLAAGLVDEFCLTTSPVIGGRPPALPSSEGLADVPVVLTQLLVDEASAVYARWSLLTDGPPAAPRASE